MPSINLTFTSRDWIIALFIIALAFGYRAIIIVDRATAPDNIAAFDPLPDGADQITYYTQALGFADGSYPPDTFAYQPGLSYFLYAASQLIRTTNLGALRLFTAFLAALNCGLMIAVGRLATGRRDAGILAGLLLALYPVSAFYDSDFVITSQAVILATLALFGILWLWRSPRQWAGAVLLGLSTGAAAVTRLEVAVLAPICGLWLITLHRNLRSVAQVALAAIIALAIVAPVVIHNQRGGADYLISAAGPAEMYRGNNRDADGTRSDSNASDMTHNNYLRYLENDIALEPLRFVELVLHKIGLTLSSLEPGNNLSFPAHGVQVSPVLAWNPLNFSLLLATALYGGTMLIKSGQKPVALLLLLASHGFIFMILLIWVESRIRTPLIVMLIPAAAYGLVQLLDALRRDSPRRIVRDFLPVAAGIAVILLLIGLAVEYLPRKLTVPDLPPSAVASHLIYDDVLELVGWEIQEAYSPKNSIAPFRPYVTTLYWRLLEPTETDYSFSLKYLINGERVTSIDRPIGMIIYPPQTTSEFNPDTIYVEHVGLSYRRITGPLEMTGTMEVYVYPERDFEQVLSAIAQDGTPYDTVLLAQPAIRDGKGRSQFEAPGENIAFGDLLLLQGWQFPAAAQPGENITITTGWQTTEQRIDNSYAIGVFLFKDGDYIMNVDSPPYDGDLLTLSIPTDYRFDDAKSLQLPLETGSYEIRIGVYDQNTVERLPVAGAIDDLYPIGSILVAENETALSG